MNTFPSNNTDDGVIERTILWQYEDATKLRSLILSWRDFFDEATTGFFDELTGRIDLTDENIDDYGLSVWGDILNVPRPLLSYIPEGESASVERPLSSELYRRILLGRLRLSEGNASVPDFIEYAKLVFDGKIKVRDWRNMGLTFVSSGIGTLTREEGALLNQYPEVVWMWPAGVRTANHSTSLMFGLDGQQNEPSVVNVGGLDESGFNWRLTPKGNWR